MNNQQKIEIFKDVFKGRQDAYGEGDGLCVKKIVSNTRLKAHLTGKKRIGIYLLSPNIQDGSGCLMACYDIDQNVRDIAEYLAFQLEHIEIPTYIEKSKSKGFHVWVFFSEAVDAKIARAIFKYGLLNIIDDLGITDEAIELFPKQTTIAEENGDYAYGNYINLPLFGGSVEDGKTVFLDPEANYKPYANQWQFLQSIKKVQPDKLTEIMEAEDISPDTQTPQPTTQQTTKRVQPSKELEKYNACEFFQYCAENAQTLSEPLWYAMLSNLARFKNGREIAHNLSQTYPEYTKEETDNKFDHAQKASGPITCQKVAEKGFECPSLQRCKANAPAGLFVKVQRQEDKRQWTSENSRPPEPVITEAESSPMPQLPNVWVGIFETYRKAMETVTEAPDDYHFACLLNILGIAAGRSCRFQYGQQTFLNFYTCLVGPTGKTRKTTAMKKAIHLLPHPEDFDVNILQRLATPEGLLYQMKDDEYMDEPKILTTLSEIATLMRKAKSPSGMGLIETLTELYDFHEVYRHPTLSNPIEVFEPWLSVMGGSTQRWLEDTLSTGEILGGFSNRWMYFTGEPKEPIPHPASEQQIAEYQVVCQFVQDIAQTDFRNTTFTVAETARSHWDEFYISHQKREWPNENIASLVRRVPEHVKKVARIFAIALETTSISESIMEISIEVGKYLVSTVHHIFNLFSATQKGLYEAKIRQKVIDFGGECTRRKLAQYLRSSVSGQELNWALQAMAENDEISLWIDDKDPRYSKKMVTMLTDEK